jgi:hypothetical protein
MAGAERACERTGVLWWQLLRRVGPVDAVAEAGVRSGTGIRAAVAAATRAAGVDRVGWPARGRGAAKAGLVAKVASRPAAVRVVRVGAAARVGSGAQAVPTVGVASVGRVRRVARVGPGASVDSAGAVGRGGRVARAGAGNGRGEPAGGASPGAAEAPQVRARVGARARADAAAVPGGARVGAARSAIVRREAGGMVEPGGRRSARAVGARGSAGPWADGVGLRGRPRAREAPAPDRAPDGAPVVAAGRGAVARAGVAPRAVVEVGPGRPEVVRVRVRRASGGVRTGR